MKCTNKLRFSVVLVAASLALGCSEGFGEESSLDPSDAGADTAPVSCISARCSSKVGGTIATPGDLCGSEPNAGDSFVIWFGGLVQSGSVYAASLENCVCQKGDAGTFTSCAIVTPSQCAAQTTCGSCNTTPACSWCKGSAESSQPYCSFRSAFECTDNSGGGGLASRDCSR